MICPKCNAELKEGSKFCSNCGFEFNKNDKTENKKNKNLMITIGFWIGIMIVTYILCLNIPLVPNWAGSRVGKFIVIIELIFFIKELFIECKK